MKRPRRGAGCSGRRGNLRSASTCPKLHHGAPPLLLLPDKNFFHGSASPGRALPQSETRRLSPCSGGRPARLPIRHAAVRFVVELAAQLFFREAAVLRRLLLVDLKTQ